MNYKPSMTRKALPKRNVLVAALAVGLGISGLAFGQATSGSLFGSAPAGDTVQVTSNSGLTRTATVGTNGQWSIGNLPLGTYTVTLTENGQTVATQNNVVVHVGAGVPVTLAAGGGAQNAQNLGAVQVTANALPSIDVTTIHNSTIITAQQLRTLPVGHSAMDIALLTPGTVASTAFNGAITFGGSSGSENGFYVNGYNTGAPYRNMSGFFLPYGAIGQQATLAGGFGAKYGRSDGGVISQTGKRGTNQWHFGGQIRWAPRSIQTHTNDTYHPYIKLPTQLFPCVSVHDAACVNGLEPMQHDDNYRPGTLNSDNSQDGSWSTTYTAYVGGPIIKDKLFFFIDVAVSEGRGSSFPGVNSVSGVPDSWSESSNHDTTMYGKIDWNINDSNVLEFTYLGEHGKRGMGRSFLTTDTGAVSGDINAINDQSTNDSVYYIAHWTSYLSDNATLSVLYGHGRYKNPPVYSGFSGLPYVSGRQNCAVFAAGSDALDNCNLRRTLPYPRIQTRTSVDSPKVQTASHGLRVDFTYQLGNHKLGIGIDNMYYYATDQGTEYTGPAAPPGVIPFNGSKLDHSRWIYGTLGGYNPGVGPHLDPDGPNGSAGYNAADDTFYYTRFYQFGSLAGMRTKQKAFYLQDNWQVTPNLLAVIGVRDDQFVNYNNRGLAFVNEKNLWSPRVGLSWDVFGDSSLKIYGNVGRYYLALPLNAANRAANDSTLITQYFTYTGIDPETGIPQGLSYIYDPTGNVSSFNERNQHVYSVDGEYGNVKDPRQITAGNLKPSFVDQINVGFDAKLGEHFQYGASLHYRHMGAFIDDNCYPVSIGAKMKKMGLDPNDYSGSLYKGSSCRLINPGQTSNINVKNDDGTPGYTVIPMTFEDWGYPMKPKRRYASVDMYFQRNFDGKWSARLDYTYASGYGNTAGQIKPNIGQDDVSKTEDWDYPAIMEGAYGQLMNVRRNIFRIRGSYQVTPEFRVGLVGTIASGTPQECRGYTGTDALGNPQSGYGGGSYHWCAGRIVHPGSSDPLAGHTPWTHIYNLNLVYIPAFTDHRLKLKMIVYNLTNEQNATSVNGNFTGGAHIVSNSFHYPSSRTAARSIDLVLSYDY